MILIHKKHILNLFLRNLVSKVDLKNSILQTNIFIFWKMQYQFLQYFILLSYFKIIAFRYKKTFKFKFIEAVILTRERHLLSIFPTMK